MKKAKNAIPDGYRTLTPVLTLDDAKNAIAWYHKALGAEELTRSNDDNGHVVHAALKIGDSCLMVHDTMMGGKGPKAMGGSPASLWIYVDDCDALFKRAVAVGAKVIMPIENAFWGDRCGTLEDPFGYSWSIATHIEDLTHEEIQQRQNAFFRKQAQHT